MYSKEAYFNHGLNAAIKKKILIHRTEKSYMAQMYIFQKFSTISRSGDLGFWAQKLFKCCSQFVGPEIVKMLQFLGPEIAGMLQSDF